MTIATILFYTHALCMNYQKAQVRDRPEHAIIAMQSENTTIIGLYGATVVLTCQGKKYKAWMPEVTGE